MDIRYPIVQAGMSGFTITDLVAGVSNAGVLILWIRGGYRMAPYRILLWSNYWYIINNPQTETNWSSLIKVKEGIMAY
jgi:NAD(P)H-dependent flavin oxidoreductase YrpB (nitropropane dioxygenase family)